MTPEQIEARQSAITRAFCGVELEDALRLLAHALIETTCVAVDAGAKSDNPYVIARALIDGLERTETTQTQ